MIEEKLVVVLLASEAYNLAKMSPLRMARFIEQYVKDVDKVMPVRNGSREQSKLLLHQKVFEGKLLTVKLVTRERLVKGILHGVSTDLGDLTLSKHTQVRGEFEIVQVTTCRLYSKPRVSYDSRW